MRACSLTRDDRSAGGSNLPPSGRPIRCGHQPARRLVRPARWPGQGQPTSRSTRLPASRSENAAKISLTPRKTAHTPRLSDAQIDALATRGQRRPMAAGEVLYHEGDRNCEFFVIVAGTVTMLDGYGGPAERVDSVHGAGRFLGEFGLLTGQPAFLTALAGEPGEVVVVPVERLRLRELVARDAALGDMILRAYLLRRALLIDAIRAHAVLIATGALPQAGRAPPR